MRALHGWIIGAWLVLAAGACTARHAALREGAPAYRELPPEPATEDAPPGPPTAEHGRSAVGFVLESTLRARRIHNGRPSMVLELGHGGTVINGDRLQVFLRTSRDAYLYVAFCSQKAGDPRYPGLKVFPEQGAIRVRAYETAIVPDRMAEIRLDNQPGRETLYLILSRTELSTSDTGLAQVIAAARQGSRSADCGTSFQTAVAGSGKQPRPKAAWSSQSRGHIRPSAAPATATGAPTQASGSAEPDPVVEIQRGGDIVWNEGMPMGVEADPDGVVVLRYGLTHESAP